MTVTSRMPEISPKPFYITSFAPEKKTKNIQPALVEDYKITWESNWLPKPTEILESDQPPALAGKKWIVQQHLLRKNTLVLDFVLYFKWGNSWQGDVSNI